jgi:hypothetical protein
VQTRRPRNNRNDAKRQDKKNSEKSFFKSLLADSKFLTSVLNLVAMLLKHFWN